MSLPENIWNNNDLIAVLERDGVVVMPTDTIYGMVGRAQHESVVNRIYTIRKRNPDKPCIILIADTSELEKFSVTINEDQKKEINKYWSFDHTEDLRPRAVSIILDCPDEKLFYLHRGTNTLAFRMPSVQGLRELLLKTGPLIAPSANTEKFPASESIEDARGYFADAIDLYVDGGPIISKASKIIQLHKDGTAKIIRS